MRGLLVGPCVSALAALAALAAPAAADDASFVTLDRIDAGSRVGAGLGLHLYDSAAIDHGLRVDLFASHALANRMVLHGALGISWLAIDGGEDGNSLTNLELGIGYLLESPGVTWVLRGSLMLPAAGDDTESFVTNLNTRWYRMTDLYSSIPELTAFRLSASPVLRRGLLVGRADLGIDVPLDDPNGADVATLLRVNLGVGLDTGMVGAFAELTTLANLEAEDDDDVFVHSLALTARYTGAAVQPALAVTFPLDDEARGNVTVVALEIQGVY